MVFCGLLKNFNYYEKNIISVINFVFLYTDAHTYVNMHNISVSLLCSENLDS